MTGLGAGQLVFCPLVRSCAPQREMRAVAQLKESSCRRIIQRSFGPASSGMNLRDDRGTARDACDGSLVLQLTRQSGERLRSGSREPDSETEVPDRPGLV